MANVQPLYDLLNASLKQYGIFHEKLSVDESMVPYFGRHSAKQYIRGKPIRYGYKIWSLCGNDGCPNKLDLYQGKVPNQPAFPLGTRIVSNLMNVDVEKSDPKKHELYIDNFFTSHDLLLSLRKENIKTTGTIRDNRTGGATKLMENVASMRKKDRGHFDHRCDGEVYICRWHDNSVVTIASNHQTHIPVAEARRRVKGASGCLVKQPHLIKQYNEGMGGVDLMDRLLGSYRPRILGKKWYWSLFLNALNTSVVAAWRIHTKFADNNLSHLDFRSEVSLCLLKSVPSRTSFKRPRMSSFPDDVRFDGFDHYKAKTTTGRCKVCKKNTNYQCTKCLVRLHYDRATTCSVTYHTKPE